MKAPDRAGPAVLPTVSLVPHARLVRRPARRLVRAFAWSVMFIVAGGAAASIYLYDRLTQPIALPPIEPVDLFRELFDTRSITIATTANWQKIPTTVPRWQFVSDPSLWLRMHFEDWDRLPADLRAQGLEHMLDQYGHLATAHRRWPTMTAHDWDRVPQPIRAMAIVGMIERWMNHYNVGARYELDAGDLLRSIKAIAMSESWFNHRAVYVNRNGSMDVGLAGASDFARRAMQRLFDDERADFVMSDEAYFNPWFASRWLVFWFDLMLEEAQGDRRLAIRAYNWGIGRALDGAGGEYLAAVERRRQRYFEGPSGSPTWRVLSEFRRQRAGLLPLMRPPETSPRG